MSNEPAYALQTDSDPGKIQGNGMEGCVDNNLQVWLTWQFYHL